MNSQGIYDAHQVIEAAVQENPALLAKIRAGQRADGTPLVNSTSAAPAEVEAIIPALEMFIEKYVVLPEHAALPLACWATATYFYQQFEVFPYLHVTSPVKECGKTRLGQVLCQLAANPLLLSGVPSEASLFRTVDSGDFTIVMDEIEGLRNGRDARAQAVLSIINSGYKKGAVVLRCEPPKMETRRFSTYCPKVLIGIGSVPDTVRSRSIVISMRRKRAGETAGRFREVSAKAESEPLRAALVKLAEERGADLAAVYEEVPDILELRDRDAEIWTALFAVCAVLAPQRIGELRSDAVALSGAKSDSDVDESLELRLLADIGGLLPGFARNVPSAELVSGLKGLPESPWGELGRELTANRLARMLRGFQVCSRTVRVGSQTAKGYLASELQEAISLYIQPEVEQSVTPSQTNGDGHQ